MSISASKTSSNVGPAGYQSPLTSTNAFQAGYQGQVGGTQSAAGGGSPAYPNWPFVIGSIQLNGFEIPSEFTFGHDMDVAIHKYISYSGQPAIKTQVLGSFYLPTKWSGTLYYSTAMSRAIQLDQMMLQGAPVTLQWGPYQWTVVISKFEAKVHHQLEIDYEMDVVVIDDQNGLSISPTSPVSFDSGIQQQFNLASAAMTGLAVQQAQQTLSLSEIAAQGIDPNTIPTVTIPTNIFTQNASCTTLLQNAYPLSQASYSTILTVVQAFENLNSSLQSYTDQLEAQAVLEGDLEALSNCLVALQGYGLVITNLNQLLGISSSAPSAFQYVGSLFDLAAQYYPGAAIDDAVSLIAQSNGLNDFYVYTATTLTLPPLFQ